MHSISVCFGNQSRIQIMITSLCASICSSKHQCVPPLALTFQEPHLSAHVFYTSKWEVKLFQLGLQRRSGRTNLLMKELTEPIILPRCTHCSQIWYIFIGSFGERGPVLPLHATTLCRMYKSRFIVFNKGRGRWSPAVLHMKVQWW